MLPATIVNWLDTGRLERRQLVALLAGGLALQSAFSYNQRAILMPWSWSDHPAITEAPAAFFARVVPVSPGNGGPTFALLARGAPPSGIAGTPGGPAGDGTPDTVVDGTPFTPVQPAAFAAQPLPGFQGLPPGAGNTSPGLAPPSQIDTTDSVPEASTWAMMLLGFGVVGAAMRRRKRVPVSSDDEALSPV